MDKKETAVLRELAKRYAEVAALPVQEEKKSLWRKLNAKKPERPMVSIDQICWNEMNYEDELTEVCESPDAAGWETFFRRTLYRWKHFPCDMVVNNYLTVTKAVRGVGFGISVKEEVLATDSTGNVLSHAYENQFASAADLDKIKIPKVWHDEAETARRLSVARELFDGILDVRVNGITPYISVWDPIATWMGVQNACLTLADDPELMHALVDRVVAGYMSQLDQLEAQGLLEHTQPLIHCTGAWTDALPADGFDAEKPRLRDIWAFGLAQMFSTVSPAMFDEFEIEPNLPLFRRFGQLYYGCCDPLDGKMAQVRKIPNLVKVSISPWANKERGAAEIGRDYVFSNKPNPAWLATAANEDTIRADLIETRNICRREGCPLEFILKDISTVGYDPGRLWNWEKIAMEAAQG